MGDGPATQSLREAYGLARRGRDHGSQGTPGAPAMMYHFGECTLDTQRHQLERAGQPVRLRSKAFQILLYLLEHRDRTILKSELYAQVWPQSFISEATLESTLRAVRRAIGDSGRAQQLIHTVYGYGYQFVGTVEELIDLPAEREAKAPGVRPDTVAAPAQGPSAMTPLLSDQGAAIGPDGREGGGGTDQKRASTPGDLRQPGEWKLVTVLCAAPGNRPCGGGQQDADTWYRQLSRLYTLCQPVVQRYGGTLQPVLGDHVLAVFGAPVAQEDHAQRAVLAALELQHRVREAGIDGKTRQGDALGLRVGLSTGQVAVGGIGDASAGQAAVVGETVMRALALQAQAAPETILCSATTAQLLQEEVRIEAVAPVPVAGEHTPVAAYAVLGPHRPRPLRALARRRLAPFVGRRHELASLRALLALVKQGRGQVVGMIGEPGVGKSRVCYEFLCGSLAPPWVILETHATAYGQATHYLPVIDLLKGYFRLDDGDDLPTIRDKVSAQLRHLDDALTPTSAAFLTLLDVPVEDPPWQALEAPQRRQRTLEALKRILLRESQVQPLLLVVENLHWIDAETQAVLDTLVESLSAARLFLLTSYRPEYRHTWGSKSYYLQLRLDPLPRERARELAEALLGDDATLEPLKQRLVEQTQGNPFFLEENIRSLVETRVLVGGYGAYRLAQGLPSLQTPATVQAVLAARIDRLPAEEKQLLQTAAVIGTEVTFPLLQAISELPEERLQANLAHLQRAEFLYETSLFPELAYTFKHALTQVVAYESLLPERRRVLHARIVQAMEMMYADRLGKDAERLAHHALRGELWDKAVRYCRQVGEKAENSTAVREAVAYYEQALDALGHLPERLDTQGLAIDQYHSLGGVLSLLGEHQRSLALLGEAEARARQLNDRVRLGRALSRMVTLRTIVGDVDGAMAAARQALELAATLGNPGLQVHASYRLGQAYVSLGDYRQAAAVLRGNVQVLRGNVEPLVHGTPGLVRLWCINSQAWLGQVLGILGKFAEGRGYGEEALHLASLAMEWRADAPIITRARLGSLYLAEGDLEAAIRVFEEGLALCRDRGQKASLGWTVGGLGEAYAHTGRVAEGLAVLEEARRDDLRTGALGGAYITHLRQLSTVYLLAGRHDDAWQHASQALDLARQLKARGEEALALRRLGAVHAHADPPDAVQAEAHYQQALALAEALGMRPLVAHCHVGLGTLYAKADRPEQARAEVATAIDLYRAMDMTFWLPQAEATLAHIGG